MQQPDSVFPHLRPRKKEHEGKKKNKHCTRAVDLDGGGASLSRKKEKEGNFKGNNGSSGCSFHGGPHRGLSSESLFSPTISQEKKEDEGGIKLKKKERENTDRVVLTAAGKKNSHQKKKEKRRGKRTRGKKEQGKKNKGEKEKKEGENADRVDLDGGVHGVGPRVILLPVGIPGREVWIETARGHSTQSQHTVTAHSHSTQSTRRQPSIHTSQHAATAHSHSTQSQHTAHSHSTRSQRNSGSMARMCMHPPVTFTLVGASTSLSKVTAQKVTAKDQGHGRRSQRRHSTRHTARHSTRDARRPTDDT